MQDSFCPALCLVHRLISLAELMQSLERTRTWNAYRNLKNNQVTVERTPQNFRHDCLKLEPVCLYSVIDAFTWETTTHLIERDDVTKTNNNLSQDFLKIQKPYKLL